MSERLTIALLVACIIGVVVGVTYFLRQDGPVTKPVSARPATAPDPSPAVPATAPEPAPLVRAPAPPNPLPTPPAPVPVPPPQDIETSKDDPRLVVPPVDEPAMPLDAREGEKYGYVPLPNGGGFVFERSEGDKKIGGVVVPGRVLITRGVVELFGCGEGGKEHETVLRLTCDLQSLDVALTLARLKRGKLPEKLDISLPDQGSRVVVLVQWEDKYGKTVTYRSEDLIVSLKRERPMPRVGWTYVGRWNDVVDPTNPAPGKSHKVLAATASKSVVTTFRDDTALLDNPLPEADDDEQFAANFMILPPSDTPVRVIFRAATDGERQEIAKLEKELSQ